MYIYNSLCPRCMVFISVRETNRTMNSSFLPKVSLDKIRNAAATGDYDTLYDLLAQPLHEELYRRKTFDFMDELSPGQQLLLAFDYLRTQVGQGGFIQFIENGYIALLPAMVEQLVKIGARDMAKVLDDVLKVYVLNRDLLSAPKSVEEFAKLYDELREFEEIEERYNKFKEITIKAMLDKAVEQPGDYITPA